MMFYSSYTSYANDIQRDFRKFLSRPFVRMKCYGNNACMFIKL